MSASLLLADRLIHADSFNRADNASSLGTAETGQSYTVNSGTAGILSNQAYFASITTLAIVTFSAPCADGTWTIAFPTVATNTRALARSSGATDHLLVNAEAASYVVYRRVSGVVTGIGTIATTPANNDVITIRCAGSTITVYLNGVARVTVTETFNQTSLGFGWGATSTTSRFENARMTR